VSLSINVLGKLSVFDNGQPVTLPNSKRTRALLAYLSITDRPSRRDHLCEVFWKIPDDPRGALRWSLSKIRPYVNDKDTQRLIADRERVALNIDGIEIDYKVLQHTMDDPDLSVDQLQQIADKLQQTFLQGIELKDQPLFQRWIEDERQEIKRRLVKVLARLSKHPEIELLQRLSWTRRWEAEEPFNPQAASHLLTLLHKTSNPIEAGRLSTEFAKRFGRADISWPPDTDPKQIEGADCNVKGKADARELLAQQKIQFCTTNDGVRIAYASVGKGAPIVKAANWISHLELDWDAPIWSPMFRELAHDHQFIRYDERGNGLSDWNVKDISFEAFVNDLETVVDTNQLEQFVLLGISQGAAVSIEYAIRHPERVKQLILFGGYAQGWRIGADEALIKEREAVTTLTALGWGQNNPAYRQIFSSTFLPSATSDEHAWFNEFQRLTTSPENAVRFLSVFSDIDVQAQLTKVKVPTLVIHSLGDLRVPAETGRNIAESIPNAEFVGLESDGHLLLSREPASKVFVETVRNFLKRHQ
jgi:pimeloyl-ACP methyl ester carboxylesterase/DNA-binding SARP family transcriptional activator